MAAFFHANLRKPREYRRTTHLDRLSDEEMRSRYRFGHDSLDFLEDLLKEDLEHPTSRGNALSVRDQLMIALRFYASGNFLEVIGDTMGFNKGTVSRAIEDVTNSLLKHFNDFVTWPTLEEKTAIKRAFFRKKGFPNVVGCIDGTHVRIQGPREDEPSFINRKGFHSVNIQAVCDHEGKFTSFCASWPGSAHDSHVFRTSGLRQKLEAQHRTFSDGVILGDSGYPCRPFLQTPFILVDTPARLRYQKAHTGTRVTIERTFGRWKRRFHVLHSEVVKMLVIVVAMFGICWLPLHLFTLILDFYPEIETTVSIEILTSLFISCHWLAMSNSFANPIIYGFTNESFRADLVTLFYMWFPCCVCLTKMMPRHSSGSTYETVVFRRQSLYKQGVKIGGAYHTRTVRTPRVNKPYTNGHRNRNEYEDIQSANLDKNKNGKVTKGCGGQRAIIACDKEYLRLEPVSKLSVSDNSEPSVSGTDTLN